jgi:phasin
MTDVTEATETKTAKTAKKTEESIDEAVDTATRQAEEFVSRMELPEAVRAFAERSIEQTRDAYGKMRDAAQQATSMLEDSTARASQATTAIQKKTVDFVEANCAAGFKLTRDLLDTRDVSKAVELQLAFARSRTEAFANHMKEMGAFATSAAPAASEAMSAQFSKYLERMRSSFAH